MNVKIWAQPSTGSLYKAWIPWGHAYGISLDASSSNNSLNGWACVQGCLCSQGRHKSLCVQGKQRRAPKKADM